jgi:hypothetical protein
VRHWQPDRGRLQFRTIFLAAEMPRVEDDDDDDLALLERDTRLETEEAVISLARAVFAEGGEIAMIEDPVLSPLITLIAGEYLVPQPAEELVRVDSETKGRKSWRPVSLYRIESEGLKLHQEVDHMAGLGHVTVATLMTPFRRSDPGAQIEECLTRARPDAMVCIGGNEQVDEQCRIFLEQFPDEPLFILAETGGAAAQWGERSPFESERVIVFDHHVLGELHRRDLDMQTWREDRREEPETHFTPYSLIVQLLIRSLFNV